MRQILVTGGAGFIGSHFVHFVLEQDRDCRVVVLDRLTYAGNLERLADVLDTPRCEFRQGDVADPEAVAAALPGCEAVVNFAAETHVDRSLLAPQECLHTNAGGTLTLLEACRERGISRFLQVSTDEVYGSVESGVVTEDAPLRPGNPYSACKAAGDLLVLAYWNTFRLPVVITRGSNTYGPWQYPEKLIPLMCTNALEDEPLPVYGDGRQQRDWLHAWDHCAAIWLVLQRGEPGSVYNIAGGESVPNIEIVRTILKVLEKPETLIRYVADRPGHDRRYSISSARIAALGWRPRRRLAEALPETIRWYRENEAWWKKIKSGEFQEYYRRMYRERPTLESPSPAA